MRNTTKSFSSRTQTRFGWSHTRRIFRNNKTWWNWSPLRVKQNVRCTLGLCWVIELLVFSVQLVLRTADKTRTREACGRLRPVPQRGNVGAVFTPCGVLREAPNAKTAGSKQCSYAFSVSGLCTEVLRERLKRACALLQQRCVLWREKVLLAVCVAVYPFSDPFRVLFFKNTVRSDFVYFFSRAACNSEVWVFRNLFGFPKLIFSEYFVIKVSKPWTKQNNSEANHHEDWFKM